MGFLRKKLDRIASGVKADPTESPLFGAFVGGTLVHDIEQTGLTSWARARPGAVGLEAEETNYPDAWRAGRELARARYAERLKKHEPIPTDKAAATAAAGHEGVALMNAIQICLQLEFNSGALTLEEIDQKAVSACLISYAQTLLRLFEDHWNT